MTIPAVVSSGSISKPARSRFSYRGTPEHGLKGPNDIVFDDQGGFYFTDLGKVRPREMDRGALYYAKADGSMIKEIAFPLITPNGIGLSPDGKTLYAVETEAARLWSWPVLAPGELAQGTLAHSSWRQAGERCRWISAFRFAGPRQRRAYLRGHLDQWRHHRHFAGRPGPSASRPDAGSLDDQYLLWWQRSENRLHYALEFRAIGRYGLAEIRPRIELSE